MSIKGFLLLMVTVVVIGGSIGGAFSGGLALGRGQNGELPPETAVLQQIAGGQSFSGGLPGGQLSGATPDGQGFRTEGQAQTGQDAPSGFGGGAFGGRDGFGGGISRSILNGTVGAVDGNLFTVTTDSGETQVNLGDDSTIQLYESGSVGDLSPGDRVLVIASGDVESGAPVDAASVIVNPPEGAGLFGAGGFGGRPRSP